MNHKKKIQALSDEIDLLYKIENDAKAKTIDRISAREERVKLTRELNDLLQSVIDAKLD